MKGVECKGMNGCLEHGGTQGLKLKLGALLDELRLHNHPRLASNDEVRVSFLDAVGLAVAVAMVSMRWLRILMARSEIPCLNASDGFKRTQI